MECYNSSFLTMTDQISNFDHLPAFFAKRLHGVAMGNITKTPNTSSVS